jgi:hypothetical protein
MASEPLTLAGERMRITEDDEGTTTIAFDDVGTGRVCGACQLCCKLLPVPVTGLNKAAGERCRHSKAGKGCTIYATRPFECRTWACRWLADPKTAGMPRPDRCHYVIDMETDYATMRDAEGNEHRFNMLQVWVDPAYPDAHRAPELRAFMLTAAERWGVPTIVRFSSTSAIVVWPPPIAGSGEWFEQRDVNIVARDAGERGILERYRGREVRVHLEPDHGA